MRLKTLLAAAAMATTPWAATAQPAKTVEASHLATPLRLEDALVLAEQANPALRSRQAQLVATQGARTDANALLYNNPQLVLEGTRREVPQVGLPEERRKEWSASLSQTLEIAGQAGHRRNATAAALTALTAEIEDLRRQVRADVARQFYRVLALQQRLQLEAQAVQLFDSTAAAVQKRRAAGEDTKLDANVTAVEAERARNQLAQVEEQLTEACGELAEKIQLPPARTCVVKGDLAAMTDSLPYGLDSLLARVLDQPRLAAIAAREESARAKLKLEQSSRYPDVTLGVNVGREGPLMGRERLTTLTVSLPLPLFKRNAAGIGQAAAELGQAEIERAAAIRDVQAQVRILWSKLDSLKRRVARLRDVVLPALSDNQQLSLKSQRAGEIGLLELIVFNRQALDARRDLIEALTDLHATRIALELAAGWQSTQGTQP
ncbi:TolC family protein [Roseateles flavus]|uniref:TolC family protein n=1 Tax=Roseateles flavus TaxID=3149041 RepID=A0ABV0GFA7_9BURK